MNISELLDAAKRQQGRYQDIADKLGVKPPRLSEWKKGVCTPDTSQIALIAEMAGLPVLETVAEIENSLRPNTALIWHRVLGKIKAGGVAAAWLLTLQLASQPGNAHDANNLAQKTQGAQTIHCRRYVSRLRQRMMALMRSNQSRSGARVR
jgi:transcriptional regulator with XRE-family HTH domain